MTVKTWAVVVDDEGITHLAVPREPGVSPYCDVREAYDEFEHTMDSDKLVNGIPPRRTWPIIRLLTDDRTVTCMKCLGRFGR